MAAFNETKKIATLGVMAALSTVLTVMGTVISVNTLFFTAAASFLAGIVLIRFGRKAGLLFYVVCAALDFFVNPNKLHVLLYVAMAGYIVFSELTYSLLCTKGKKTKEWLHRGIRFILFMLFYVPIIVFFPTLIVTEQFLKETWVYPAFAGAGIAGWILYDIAYGVFKRFFAQRLGKLF